ncbi:uncharacterized protein [Miscanthus floridulus]|uniref:uncharacterized protein n=1 Tax=Miscanthus floridulus TaxID=154761 RepID=UPI003459FC48
MGIAEGKKRRPVLICCGVLVAVIILLAVIFVALYFTLFRPRSPKVVATAVGAEIWPKSNGGGAQDLNLTVYVDVTVNNPNYAAFRYGDVATVVRYHGEDVGLSVVPAGEIGPRETQTIAAAIEVNAGKVATIPYFWVEFPTGKLPFQTATEVAGKAVVLGTFKIKATSEVACDVTVQLLPANATSECTSTVHIGR